MHEKPGEEGSAPRANLCASKTWSQAKKCHYKHDLVPDPNPIAFPLAFMERREIRSVVLSPVGASETIVSNEALLTGPRAICE